MEQGNRSDSTLMSDRQASPDRIRPDDREGARAAAIERMLTKPEGEHLELHAAAIGIADHDGGVTYCDAAGQLWRKPVSDWIAYMAQRLYTQARQEMARHINEPAIDDADRERLSVVLRRDLRIDALHILAHHPHRALKAAQDAAGQLPEIPAMPIPGAGTVSPDLIAAVEAHREAHQLMLHDPVQDDVRTEANVARATALADAVRHFESRSLADLRFKTIYLFGGAINDVIDEDSRASFVSVERDINRLAAGSPGEAEPQSEQSWPLEAPASLAAACDWVVGHVDWINATVSPEDWNDDRLSEESEKTHPIWARAIAEPAQDIATLAAKARMVRHDWLNEFPDDEADGMDRERLTLTILREVIALAAGAEARAAPVDPVFIAIAESQRLFAVWDATYSLPTVPPRNNPHPDTLAAQAAFNEHKRNVLLTTVPTSAEGCKALAKYVGEFQARECWALDEDDGDQSHQNLRILALIARSPMTGSVASALPGAIALTAPISAGSLAQAILNGWVHWHAVTDYDAEEETPAEAAAFEMRWALTDAAEELPAAPENLLVKALALAWTEYTDEWKRGYARADYGVNGRLALDIHTIVTGQAPPTQRHPDPVHALIAASRAAEAEMAAFQNNTSGPMTKEQSAEEDRLCDVQNKARDAALGAVPTTRAGQIAMLDYVRFEMALHGMKGGERLEPDSQIWTDTHKALERALEADVDRTPRALPDLSACTIGQLVHLYEVMHSVWLHASAETQSPWCWDAQRENHNAAGNILHVEAERWGEMHSATVAEIARRTPLTKNDRNGRLGLLVRHELLCNDRIDDPALLAEATEAWGGSARG